MISDEKRTAGPIRWAMVGGGRGSQIGYIHRSATLRDSTFALMAGAFDLDPERGRAFGAACESTTNERPHLAKCSSTSEICCPIKRREGPTGRMKRGIRIKR